VVDIVAEKMHDEETPPAPLYFGATFFSLAARADVAVIFPENSMRGGLTWIKALRGRRHKVREM
jgi:hypothetical protein